MTNEQIKAKRAAYHKNVVNKKYKLVRMTRSTFDKLEAMKNKENLTSIEKVVLQLLGN